MKTRALMAAALWIAALSTPGCRRSNTIKLAWDPPAAAPKGYRVLLDDQVVMDIPPPPLDPSCSCQTVTVTVPRGPHKIAVIAYNEFGESAPSALAFVK